MNKIMIRRILILLIFCLNLYSSRAQLAYVDSLKLEIKNTENDTLRLVLLSKLINNFFDADFEQSLSYSKQLLRLSKSLNYKIEEAYATDLIGIAMTYNREPEGLEMLLKAALIVADKNSEHNILPEKYLHEMKYYDGQFIDKKRYTPELLRLDVLAGIYYDLGNFYGTAIGNTKKQLNYYRQARDLMESIKDSSSLPSFFTNLGDTYYFINQLDSGLYFSKLGNNLYSQAGLVNHSSYSLAVIGMLYYKKGNTDSALKYLYQAVHLNKKYGKTVGISRALLTLSDYYNSKSQPDSSLLYAKRAFDLAEETNDYSGSALPNASAALASLYKAQNNADSALKYYTLTVSFLNKRDNDAGKRLIQSLDYEENVNQQEITAAKTAYNNRLRTYAFLTGIGVLLIIGIILSRNNYERKKANKLLQKQKKEIEVQKRNVEETLSELKVTQAQLIQSEKMASLGELTAGIAHEIQNPLNFVNNFSEVNTELIEELKGERSKVNGERNEELEEEILNDIKENEQKINLHGKRADAIVKGMLQHSRASNGKKELTDINALADEYLRLSYQAMRSKDKAFNAIIDTHFDDSIGKINIVPQDIGRVLLNLLNNAFYAVNEKKKAPALKGENYEATVSVSTKNEGDKVVISVKDNGIGIPPKVVDKIFQPFYTTKPTGQGTGLGLSLSYDIMKAHRGEIKVESKEGGGAEFIIELPVI